LPEVQKIKLEFYSCLKNITHKISLISYEVPVNYLLALVSMSTKKHVHYISYYFKLLFLLQLMN